MNPKLDKAFAYLQQICQGHSVSRAKYDFDYKEYRFLIDDGEFGTFAITKELLDQTDVRDIAEVLRQRGVTLNAIGQSGDDGRLVRTTHNLWIQH